MKWLIALISCSKLSAAVVAFDAGTRIDIDQDGYDELAIQNHVIGSFGSSGSSQPVWNLWVSSEIEVLTADGHLALLGEGAVVQSLMGGVGDWTASGPGFAEVIHGVDFGNVANWDPLLREAFGIPDGYSGYFARWNPPYGRQQRVGFGFRYGNESEGWRYGWAVLDLFGGAFTTDDVHPFVNFSAGFLEQNRDEPIRVSVIPEPSPVVLVTTAFVLALSRRRRGRVKPNERS